jgi:hypothetical protein
MWRWIREHGLVTVNLMLFLGFLVGMTLTGWQVSNDELAQHGAAQQGLAEYLGSGDFWEALSENWESEFLQMASYVALTIFLFQRGSSESKPIGKTAPQDEDPRRHASDTRAPWPVRRGGAVLVLYENSLLILFVVLFVAAFVTHAVSGAAGYSEEQLEHGGQAVAPIAYLGTSQFWFESLQNWQSEFMVVAVLAGAAVYLRQRGSSESKPVHAPHDETGA